MASKYLAEVDSLSGYAAAVDARAQYERLASMIDSASHAEAAKAVEEGRRLVGLPIDRDTGLPIVGARPAADEARVKTVAQAAAKRYAETGDYAAAVAEVLAGVERTRA